MRIIAGTARGRRLISPDGRTIRPTSDRVRENIFNILAAHIEEARFLDLFCGTGAIGVEALSRGAAQATFIDNNEAALRLARQNLLHCQVAARSICLRLTLPDQLHQASQPYTIIFADPPYEYSRHEDLLRILQERHYIAEDGHIIIETAHTRELPETVAGLARTRQRRYGDTTLHFYRPVSAISASVP